MKINKLLTTAAILSVVVSSVNTALANEYLPMEVTGPVVTFKIDNPENNRILSMITKSDGKLLDDDIFGAYETGNEIIEFTMPDFREDIDGEYTLYISGKPFGKFCYAGEESREEVMTELQKEEADLENIFDKNSEYYYALRVLNFDLTGYESASDKGKVLNLFKQNGGMTADTFNKATAIVLVKEGTDISEALKNANPVFEGKSYNEQEEEFKSRLESYMKEFDFASVDEFNSEYERANVLYLLNNAKFAEIEELLEKYVEALELSSYSSYTAYKNLSNVNKDKVNDYIVLSFSQNECTSVQTVKNVLSAAIASLNPSGNVSGGDGNSGGGNSGGGSSSGGVGGSNIFYLPTEGNQAESENHQGKYIFSDLGKAKWAEDAILDLAEKGIVSGDGTGKFNPNDAVTREQFVKMLVAATNIETEKAGNPFDDVDSNAWYADYVTTAYKEKIVMGVSDTKFGIGNLIKRQDMACMAYRALKGKEPEEIREWNAFDDFDKISEYATEAVKALYVSGVINGMGDNMFNPEATATRAESAVIIYNLFVK